MAVATETGADVTLVAGRLAGALIVTVMEMQLDGTSSVALRREGCVRAVCVCVCVSGRGRPSPPAYGNESIAAGRGQRSSRLLHTHAHTQFTGYLRREATQERQTGRMNFF